MTSLLLSRLSTQSALRLATIKQIPRKQIFRAFADDGRNTFKTRAARKATIKERAMAPAGEGGK